MQLERRRATSSVTIHGRMRRRFVKLIAIATTPIFIVLAVQGLASHAYTQRPISELERYVRYLRIVLPDAETFTLEEGNSRYFCGYAGDGNGGQTLVGLAFLTTDLAPFEFGYKGAIMMMVGMTTGGTITGVDVIFHNEPFGYFSIDPPMFANQFKDKSILDPIEVGTDVDEVSRATITVRAAARSIRIAARLMIREFLAEDR